MPETVELAASLMCADYRRLAEEIRALDAAGIDRYHLDVMDGHFVPNLGLGPELVGVLRSETDKPFDAHLQVEEPERFVDLFAQAGCQQLIFHIEATHHVQRLIAQIQAAGCNAGIAINPVTGLDALPHVIESVDQVIIMTVDAGFASQPFTWSVIPKMAEAHARIAAADSSARICADGGVNTQTIPTLVGAGTRVLVLGTTGLFREPDYAEAVRTARATSAAALVDHRVDHA